MDNNTNQTVEPNEGVQTNQGEGAGFQGVNCRHTSISLQISSGIQAQIISKRVGHSNIRVTHSIYSHFFDDEFKEVANKMDIFLNKKTV